MKFPTFLVHALMALASSGLVAAELSQHKLMGRWIDTTPVGYQQGYSVALSAKYAVLGASTADEQATDQGAVQVFDTVTSNWVRKILPPAPAVAFSQFGYSVALSGNLAVIGSPGTASDKGTAYLYDVSTGARRFTLTAPDGVAFDRFGLSVAIAGNTVAVGSPKANGKGAVYLFKLSTGAFIAKIQALDVLAFHSFGTAVAMEGNILAIGSPGAGSTVGAAYFYDVTTQALITKHVPPGAAAGDYAGASIALHGGKAVLGGLQVSNGEAYFFDLAIYTSRTLVPAVAVDNFGRSVAVSGDMILVGAPDSSNPGSVYEFDAATGTQLRKIVAADGTTARDFGTSLAVLHSTLLVGAPGDDTQASNAGAGYLIRSVTKDMAFTKVAARGDFAPGAAETSYGTLGSGFINGEGEVAFTSTLTGLGSNANKDIGAYNDLSGTMRLQVKSRQPYSAPILFGTTTNLSVNQPNLAVALATLTGPGITTSNNQFVLTSSISNIGIQLRAGSGIPQFSNVALLRNLELVQSINFTGNGEFAVAATLKQQPSIVLSTSDSAVIFINLSGASETVREGSLAPTLPLSNYGQVTGRICLLSSRFAWGGALTGATTTNAAIFQKSVGSAAVLVAQKGSPAIGIPGSPQPKLSTFIGETEDAADSVLYRASITGTGITTLNNEGLWTRGIGGTTTLQLRKGQLIPGLTGVSIAKIIQFWPSGAVTTYFMALVQLRGTGVTAANDLALVLMQPPGSLLVLMREGEPAAGCSPATIGTISRVEAAGYPATYAVLATLAGAPTGSELALFTGNNLRGDSNSLTTLRRPFLRLRKGQLYDNQPSKIKSISLPTTNITASGAGATGRGRAISWDGDFAITVEFDNGVRQILKGVID